MSEAFYKDVARWLERQRDFEDKVKYVLSVDEDERHFRHCDTCAYTYTVVEVKYVTEDGDLKTYEDETYFSNFVKEVAHGG